MSPNQPARAPAAARDDHAWRVELRATRLLSGAGVLDELGEVVRELGGRRVLIVTDRGIAAAGHVDRAVAALERASCRPFVFDRVEENPEEHHVAAGAGVARDCEADCLVGLGGGSAMDCAKGVNFVYTNGGRMEDYWGMGKAERPMLPSVGVPGTAGTGSEAQSFAIISRSGDHRKMACGDEKARFHTVLLDPEVAATAPPEVVAVTGMDAISHAVESFATRVRNPLSKMMAREAFGKLSHHLPIVMANPGDSRAVAEMLLGAHLAGAAIEASMLGAAHALANPLTAAYDVTHGLAVALMLPHVVRFNAAGSERQYAELLGDEEGGDHGALLAQRLEVLRTGAGLPSRLDEVGVQRSRLPELAQQASEQWTASFNPRPVGPSELLALYEEAF